MKKLFKKLFTKKVQREVDEMGDIILTENITIKELYQLAKEQGIENRTLFVKVRDVKTHNNMFTQNVVAFGRGWTKDSCILTLNFINPDEDCGTCDGGSQ